MKSKKTIFIIMILLSTGAISNQESTGYSQQTPIDTKEIIIGSITPETSQENPTKLEEQTTAESTSITPEEEAIKKWNDHLTVLKTKDQDWNKNSNIPTDSWKEKAVSLAQKALSTDKSIAETIKSAFFNAITEKIKLEDGEFTASTYALIKEFDDTIDTYLKTLLQAEEPAPKETVEEKTNSEPVEIEVETAPISPATETPVSQSEITTPSTEPAPKDALQEWNDQLEKIMTTGNSENENKNLLIKTYELAKELLSQGYTPESLFDGFQYAIFQHNENVNLFPIKIDQAIEAFSVETGIAVPNKQQQIQPQQQEYAAAIKKQAEQQALAKKQKETELKTAATVQEAIKKAHISESKMQALNRQLEEKLALEEAARTAQQIEMNKKIEQMKKELASLRKTKIEKAAPQPEGIMARAVGAVKNVASAATAWWYGEEAQEQKDIQTLDEERFKKLQDILKAMTLTPHEKRAIEENWKIFINNLRSFKDLNINDEKAIQNWLSTTQQAVEFLTIKHNIISIKDAIDITKDAIKQYPESLTFINDIKTYVTTQQQKIIEAKQKKEATELEKIQEKEKRKELAELKKQKMKDEKERIKSEQNIIESYEHEKTEWQQFLTQIAHNKQAMEQENSTYTNDALKKAASLLNPRKPVVLKNKPLLEQQLKQEFTNALLKQQERNEHKINIYKNITQFNNAINEMT